MDDYKDVEDQLMKILSELLLSKEFVEFQIGRNGEFDIFSASCIKRIQGMYGNHNSAMTLVLPYPVADMRYYEDYYDSVYIPEEVTTVHPKAAITKRNQWMVKHSDLLIAYVKHEKGGASTTLHLAKKLNIRIINVAKTSKM